jgi:integrase
LYYGNIHCNTRSDAMQSAQKDYRNQLGFLIEQRVHGGVVNHITEPTMFTYNGKPITNANTRAWREALTRAGIDDFRWHDLRHTWATWNRRAGTPTHELQRLGGWRTASMVERYAHLASDHLAESAARLGSVVAGYDLATVANK